MQVKCEKCSAIYRIPTAKLTRDVSKATCKRCGFKMTVRKEVAEPKDVKTIPHWLTDFDENEEVVNHDENTVIADVPELQHCVVATDANSAREAFSHLQGAGFRNEISGETRPPERGATSHVPITTVKVASATSAWAADSRPKTKNTTDLWTKHAEKKLPQQTIRKASTQVRPHVAASTPSPAPHGQVVAMARQQQVERTSQPTLSHVNTSGRAHTAVMAAHSQLKPASLLIAALLVFFVVAISLI